MSDAWQTIVPTLVHIQANLAGELGLRRLARFAGFSEFHFQRTFRQIVGESPKAYVKRLRLERAAFRLVVGDTRLLDLALECGFHSHESFTRAFAARYGMPPRAYRTAARRRQPRLSGTGADAAAWPAPTALSATRIVRLRAVHLAFARHVGPYGDVTEELFATVERWAVRRRLPGPRWWLGLGHDAPSTTPAAKMRFDAALVVPAAFASDGVVGHQLLPAGDYAMTTVVGPLSALPAAYRAVAERLHADAGWRLAGLPAVEFYHTTRVDLRHELIYTDVCLPVARKPRRSPR